MALEAFFLVFPTYGAESGVPNELELVALRTALAPSSIAPAPA
jgi:hypothetical protein